MFPPIDDSQAMAVFADMLSVRGDPRGELVQLQLAREARPSDLRLSRAEEQFLARHDRQLLGPLRTSTSLFTFTWRRGFIVEAVLQSLAGQRTWVRGRWVEHSPGRTRIPRLVKELRALESASPLQMLTVRLARSAFGREQLIACARTLADAPPLSVVALHLLEPGQWWDASGDPGPTVERQVGETHLSVDASVSAEVFSLLG